MPATIQPADIAQPTTDGWEIRLRRVATPSPEHQWLPGQLGIALPERFNLNFEWSVDCAVAKVIPKHLTRF